MRCGAPLPDVLAEKDGLCGRCRQHPPAFDAARSWAVMEGSVRQALHRLKYHRDLALAETLAAILLGMVRSLGWQVEAVMPVPLGRARQQERGYNQAALLAFPLALGLHVPYRGGVLVRVRETRSQVGLTAAERRRNVAGAFGVRRPAAVAGRGVLLVDDVMTTGATLDAAAAALKASGARQVFAVTVARAVLRRSGFPGSPA